MELKDLVISAVIDASALAIRKYGEIARIDKKSSKDFVTEVDEECELLIYNKIKEYVPNCKFLGEEFGEIGEGDLLIVVDPIDATTNYIREIPLFDIAVSVYKDNKIILGVISCPFNNELYIAQKGKGAYLNGKSIRVSETKNLEEAIIGYNRSNHPPNILKQSKIVLSNILDKASTLRVFGTGGLDYCYLAKGSFDACITPLAEPYHSAGYLIMEEAGAKVTEYDGHPHSLNSKTIVAANPKLHIEVLKLVNML